MKTIALISCVKTKQPYTCKAKEMYISPLFKKQYAYAKKMGVDEIYILSAKYGLIHEDTIIETYNETLKGKSAEHKRQWTQRVYAELCRVSNPSQDEYLVLAGNDYCTYLLDLLPNKKTPLQGLPMGVRMSFLNKEIK